MIVKYSSIIGSLVAELRDKTKIGKVTEVVIDKEKLCVAGIAVEQSFWLLNKHKFVLNIDITYLRKDGVIIKDEDSVIELKDSIKLGKLVKEKSYGIGQKVKTAQGQSLGHVYDFLIETEDMSITKFYVKQLLKERIIPSNQILSIDGRVITVKDNYVRSKVEAMAMAESVPAA